MRRVVGETILTTGKMSTLLIKIETALNFRPLCVWFADDLNVLMPAHLMLGQLIRLFPEHTDVNVNVSANDAWKLVK